MSNHVVLRLLDSFFRHKWLHILPVVVFTALGAWYVSSRAVEYQASGVLLVEDETLLTSLTNVGGDGNNLWQSPAERAANQVNSLLQTKSFAGDVARNAGTSDATQPDVIGIQRSVGAFAAGENLVHVWSNDTDPQVARAKAAAAIDTLIEFRISSAVGDGTAAEGALDPLTEQYRDDLTAARKALDEYLNENPSPADATRPPNEQFRIDQLSSTVATAEARYTDALQKEESARLTAEQAENAIRDRFKIVDQPEVPTVPQGRMRTRLLSLAVFMVVGAIVTAASIVLGAVLDQSVRYPLDITSRLDVKVLGVVPDTSGWTLPVDEGDVRHEEVARG